MEVTGYLTPGYDGTSKAQNSRSSLPDGYFLAAGDLGQLIPEGDLIRGPSTTK